MHTRTMLALFQNPHLFVILHSLIVAGVAYAYDKVTHPEGKDHMKLFWKTLLISVSIGLILVYFIHRKEDVSTEPFIPQQQPAAPQLQ